MFSVVETGQSSDIGPGSINFSMLGPLVAVREIGIGDQRPPLPNAGLDDVMRRLLVVAQQCADLLGEVRSIRDSKLLRVALHLRSDRASAMLSLLLAARDASVSQASIATAILGADADDRRVRKRIAVYMHDIRRAFKMLGVRGAIECRNGEYRISMAAAIAARKLLKDLLAEWDSLSPASGGARISG